MERRLSAIMAADVVGYSRLMGADEQGTLARLKAVRHEFVDPEIDRQGGRIVKLMGDGALVEFGSVVSAVECAAKVQRLLAEHNSTVADDERIELRIGINLGDVIVDGDDIYGNGVNIAARLEGIATAGGVCVSRSVFDHVKDNVTFGFIDLGDQALKNIEEPVQAFQVTAEPKISAGDRTSRLANRARPFRVRREQRSIAIRPFENLSPDLDGDHLVEGVRLGIQAGLVLLPGLLLINAPAVNRFRDREISAAEAANELGVRYLLDGAVQRAGNQIRATLQLTDADAGEVIWSERYDRDLTDLFELQDEITQEVLMSLDVRVLGREWDRLWFKKLTSLQARDLFLRGNYHFYAGSPVDNEEARRIFTLLHELEPDAGYGCGIVAVTHWLDAHFGWSKVPEVSIEHAVEWAKTAIKYEETDGFGYAVLGSTQLYDGNHDQALANCQKAVGLRASCPLAYGLLASIQNFSGESRTAAKNARVALQQESTYPPSWLLNIFAAACRDSGDVEQSIPVAEEVVRLAPDDTDGRLVLCSNYSLAGRPADASRMANELMGIDPDFRLSAYASKQPYKDSAVLGRVIDCLRAAGLPE